MDNELYHHGVLGMKWGRRKVRYTSNIPRSKMKKLIQTDEQKTNIKKYSKAKKVAKGAAITAGILATAYGAYKIRNLIRDKNTLHHIKEGNKFLEEALKGLDNTREMSAEQMIRNDNERFKLINTVGKEALSKAKKDSFSKATKNVVEDYIYKLKNR